MQHFNIVWLILFSIVLVACVNEEKPAPTPSPKSTLLQTESTAYDYTAIDFHALRTPSELRQDLPRLAAYLVKPARNEREKARAIFRWITANITYDAKTYFRGDFTPHNTRDVLASGVAVCDGYANLFKQLADLSGLEAVMVSGITKGYAYHTRGRAGLVDHAWNAVKIDGQWQLLDSTWGAGHLDGNKKRFVRDFKEHYFLTPPEQFVFDHFPDDPRWQLLERPNSRQDFENMPYLRPAFFQSGLQLISHPREQVQTDKPLTVVIHAPKGSYISCQTDSR